MGTHLRVLRESFLMSTNMIGLGCFSKIFASVCFGQVNPERLLGVSQFACTHFVIGPPSPGSLVTWSPSLPAASYTAQSDFAIHAIFLK